MSASRKAARKAASPPSKAIRADEDGHGVFVLRHGLVALEKLLKQTEEVALQAKWAQKQGGSS
jgi:hypothetical protein